MINEVRKQFPRLIVISYPMRKAIFGMALLGVLQVVCRLSFVYLSRTVIDMATGGKTVLFPSWMSNFSPLITICSIMVILLITEILLHTTGANIRHTTQVKAENRMRHQLFNHLILSRNKEEEERHSGDLMNRITLDVKEVITLLSEHLPFLFVMSVQLSGAVVFLAHLSPLLAVALLSILPLFLLGSRLFAGSLRQMTHRVRETESLIHQLVQEGLQHRDIVQTLEQSNSMTQQLVALQHRLHQQVRRRTRFTLYSRTIVSLGFTVGYLTAFIYGISELHAGTITFGVMAAFLQLVAMIQAPIGRTASLIPTLITAITANERLDDLLRDSQEEQGSPIIVEGMIGIRFENVTFSYSSKGRQILKSFSHDFKPDTITAILGTTGIGKSTIARLALALQSPKEGKVTLYNTRGISVTASPMTRCNFIYVPQGNTLFSSSIRDNLLMGNPEASDEELNKALYVASAEFVLSLPEGLETRCGEKGKYLSEGEAQRIAIARSLLRPGKLMILDEATSALDIATQQTILFRIVECLPQRTILFITHRSEAAAFCGNVLQIG